MASIDPRIAMGIQPIQFENPLNQLAKMTQMGAYATQNKLANLRLQEYEQGVKGDNALSALLAQHGNDHGAIQQGLAQQGYGAKALEYGKQVAESRGKQVELDQKEWDFRKKKVDWAKQNLGELALDPALSLQSIAGRLQGAVQSGMMDPQMATQLFSTVPQVSDPAQLRGWIQRELTGALTAEQQLNAIRPKVEKTDFGGTIGMVDMNDMSPTFGKQLQTYKKTMTPDGVAADARGREANRLKAEENSITKQGIVSKKVQDVELKLQDDWRNDSKGFTETSTAMKKLLGSIDVADKNPGAALAAGTGFMKILDPNSVVRESELGMALNASGWFDRALNIANTLQAGKVMTPKQKENLKKASETLFEEAKAAQREIDAAYEQRAKAYGADPSRVIVDRGQKVSSKPAPAAGGLTQEEMQELEQLRAAFNRKK